MPEHADVVVVGAGAAGLAAARALGRARVPTMVLEARERIGGRISSRVLPGIAAPLELGAEFVHGRPQVTYDLLRAAGTTTIDVAEGRFEREGDSLHLAPDGFEPANRLIERASQVERDMSVEEFLRGCEGQPELEESIKWFRWMVEGFDAADPRRASVCAIAEEWSGPTLDAQARPLGGYAPMIRELARSLDPAYVTLRLEHAVEHLAWERGSVRISGHARRATFEVEAGAAIVTLPVPILSRVEFRPALDAAKQRALESIAMGPVVKVLVIFRSRWWERLNRGAYKNAGFFHRFDSDFPTVWTLLPLRTPVLTAWAGGPHASHLTGNTEDEISRRALISIRNIFPEDPIFDDEVETVLVADWAADRFAGGAYSYVLVGGAGARAALAEPLRSTVFFAGEATSRDSSGTVSGALESGERAAAEAISRS